MNPTVQPLKHGIGFRLVPATSSINHHASTTSSATLRQKILCKTKSSSPSGTTTTRSRGKRGQALKFHNFVANDGLPNVSGASEQPFCLREEHGTKQITVSHWKSSNEEPSVETREEDVTKKEKKESKKTPAISEKQKQSILESLLATRMANESGEGHKTLASRKISKRKPLVVRRVVHENQDGEKSPSQELRITANKRGVGEIQAEPLDLSTKKMKSCHNETRVRPQIMTQGVDSHDQSSQIFSSSRIRQNSRPIESADTIQHLIHSVEKSAAHAASIMANVSGYQLCSKMSANDGFRHPSNLNNSIHQLNSHSSSRPLGNNFPGQRHLASQGNTGRGGNISPNEADQKNCGAQKNVVKQKLLEDAFRTNGFLIKTKQVSDGDATFCKFRQLRKYTRYYLKSWHKHLPEEVNKLYKGFLPPKSTKASNSPTADTSNTTSSE